METNNNQFKNYETNDYMLILTNNMYFTHSYIETKHSMSLKQFLFKELSLRALKDSYASELERELTQFEYNNNIKNVDFEELEQFFDFEIARDLIDRFTQSKITKKDKKAILDFYKIGGDE